MDLEWPTIPLAAGSYLLLSPGFETKTAWNDFPPPKTISMLELGGLSGSLKKALDPITRQSAARTIHKLAQGAKTNPLPRGLAP